MFCGVLGRADRVCLIDARLYLLKERTDDLGRCARAEVPRAEQVHRTELELAQEIVRHARHTGVRFEWVGMHGLYGNSLEFPKSLDEQGEAFLAEVHSDQHTYLTDLAPYFPPQDKGRPRVRYHSDAQPLEVRKWDKYSLTAHCWHLIVRRELKSPGTPECSPSEDPRADSYQHGFIANGVATARALCT